MLFYTHADRLCGENKTNRHSLLTRILIGAGVFSVAMASVMAYGAVEHNTTALAFGAVASLAGIQCALDVPTWMPSRFQKEK